jgi:HD-GYP domain-containing protein (c-di-GMP phosphodiesterase class II)
MEIVTDYLESNLFDFLQDENLSSISKGKILYQTSANYVTDVFETPDKSANLGRCQNLIKNFILYVTTNKNSLKALESLIENNFYIYTHSIQVTALSLLAHAEIFMLNRDELIDIGVGSILHDFGMIFISGDITNKPEALSDIEYHKVKMHAVRGYDFFKKTKGVSDISLSIIRNHHERYDGSGYPLGLKGNDIPRSVQVTSVCDVYSALTTDRTYRKATSSVDALRIMKEDAKGFNPHILERFAEIVTSRKVCE